MPNRDDRIAQYAELGLPTCGDLTVNREYDEDWCEWEWVISWTDPADGFEYRDAWDCDMYTRTHAIRDFRSWLTWHSQFTRTHGSP